ncbi:hypothetical protein OQA88_6630 [Cercophora sp. LCS_1]
MSNRVSAIRDQKAVNDFGYRIYYSPDHCFHPWDLANYMFPEHALNDKYMALYRTKKETEPLWVQVTDVAGGDYKAVVRSYSRSMCKRALFKALERNRYTQTGKSSSDQTLCESLQGTIRITVASPLKTVNCKESKLAAHLEEIVRTRIIPNIRQGSSNSRKGEPEPSTAIPGKRN